ncbi:MAG: hypothetical protein WBD25_06845 [Terriglobales bacterium]
MTPLAVGMSGTEVLSHGKRATRKESRRFARAATGMITTMDAPGAGTAENRSPLTYTRSR